MKKIEQDKTTDSTTKKQQLRRTTIMLGFALLMVGASFFSLPVGNTSITFHNMLAVLVGILLGGAHGAAAVGYFLTVGVMGLPVFSGGGRGLPFLQGAMGGFYLGYFFAALVAGLTVGVPLTDEKTPPMKIARGTLTAFAIIYIPGFLWYRSTMGYSMLDALNKIVIPYLISDAAKALVTVVLAIRLRPVVAKFLAGD